MTLAKLSNFILETVFPEFCLNCGKQGKSICYDCLSLVAISESFYCPFCQEPVSLASPGKCLKHSSKNLDGLFSAVSYQQSLVKKMITTLKYPPYLKSIAPALGFLIVAHFLTTKKQEIFNTGENSDSDKLLLPVPSYRKKEKKRGFNPAELIAKQVSSFFNVPVESNILIKTKRTKPQMTLSRQERIENIKNCFAIKNPAILQGKTIFLIDDVFTTGVTMEECARVLKQQALAKHVFGISVAREPLDFSKSQE